MTNPNDQEREALEFYANGYNYVPRNGGWPSSVDADGGRRAKAVLARAALAAREEPRGEEPANERCYSVSEGKRCGRERHHPGIHTYFFDDGREASWIDNNLLGPSAREDTVRPEGQTTHALAVEALDEIGLVRVEIDLAESPYLLAVSQARNLGELLIEAADKLSHTEQEHEG
jgi:hypothetical protein